MGRRLRWGLADRLVEVTVRTVQGRYLIRPSSQVNLTFKGVLGRGQRHYGLPIVGFNAMSNHYHLLVIPEGEDQLADFMRFTNMNLSKELGRIHDWPGSLFERRPALIPVSDEDEAQVSRLRYMLSQGTKESLVPRPQDWPGAHCVHELLQGLTEARGIWVDRTAIWKARHRRERLPRKESHRRETVTLSPLPVWADRSREQRMEAVAEMVREIEEETSERHRREGTRPLGVKGVLRQHPHDRPEGTKRSAVPIAHAATVEVWLAMKLAYQAFALAYRDAAERLRKGLEPHFPRGCFLPTGAYLPRDGPAGSLTAR